MEHGGGQLQADLFGDFAGDEQLVIIGESRGEVIFALGLVPSQGGSNPAAHEAHGDGSLHRAGGLSKDFDFEETVVGFAHVGPAAPHR